MASHRTVVSILFLGAAFVTLACAHSWIACVDYEEYSGLFYSHEKCHAWPRSGHYYTPKNHVFGYESGMNHGPTSEMPCKTLRNDKCGYTSDHPMAKYTVGQSVVIAHPTKNHANDRSCNQLHANDFGNFVYAVPTTPETLEDPALEHIMTESHLVKNLGISPKTGDTSKYPKPGFQNAPAYCDGTDAALATNNFTVPNYPAGRYTFMWLWYFTSTEITGAYATCWEADIYATEADKQAAAEAEAQYKAQQDLAIKYDSTWGSGASGTLQMPPSTEYFVELEFPMKLGTLSIWGTTVVSTEAQHEQGIYWLQQNNPWWNPSEAGFTIAFSSETNLMPCVVPAKDVIVRMRPLSEM